MELASYNNLLGYLKDFQRTENKRMMIIQISSNIHLHHHLLLHLYHHRRQRRRRRCRNRRLPRRRRSLCSYFPRLCLLLVKLPPFSLPSLFCAFLFSWQSEICNCIMLSHFLLLAGKFEPNSWRNCVVVSWQFVERKTSELVYVRDRNSVCVWPCIFKVALFCCDIRCLVWGMWRCCSDFKVFLKKLFLFWKRGFRSLPSDWQTWLATHR